MQGNIGGLGMLVGTGLASVQLGITEYGKHSIVLPPLSEKQVSSMLRESLVGVHKMSDGRSVSITSRVVDRMLQTRGMQLQLALTLGLPGYVEWLRAAVVSDAVLALLHGSMSDTTIR